ncbi:uncharacterized protein LOC126966272 [Leptidea sinapis]|uniref:EF-hand domain-containing protein n=1 Tax=Leptidea sinapis TaxID=189913 RepID=A0A5E4Q1N9_9NEOP|nr:uncharacterized protein LOC126966272 [Leptidea sinapis]VVC92132.1 unnamed protein product [Leptidea sinapis]
MNDFDAYNPLSNVKIILTEDQLSEINDWFDQNAKPQLISSEGEPLNVVTINKIQTFMELNKFHRRSFHYPSYGEIMAEAERFKAAVTRMITRDQFIYMINKWTILPDLKHEIKLAFKVFDTENRHFLDIDELKQIVTGYENKFDEMETREMIRDANVRGDGKIFYEDFIESIFSRAPELYDEIKAEYLYDDPEDDPSVEKPIILEEPPPPEPPPPPPPKKGKKKK